MHQNRVDRNPVEPGGKRGIAPERADLPEELEKHLLCQVFRLRHVSKHAQAKTVDVPAMSFVKALKSRSVALLCAGNCLAFVPFSCGWLCVCRFHICSPLASYKFIT